MASKKSCVPLTYTYSSEALRGASSVWSCVCLLSKPCVKWRGKSVLLKTSTSSHFNVPQGSGLDKREIKESDGKNAMLEEVKKRQSGRNEET